MTSSSGRPRRTGVWILTGLSIAASLAFLLWRVAGPSDGAAVAFYADAWSVDAVRVEPVDPRSGGLASGDEVTSIAGRSLSTWIDESLNPDLDRSAVAGSDPTAYGVRRGNATTQVEVVFQRHDPSPILSAYWSMLLFVIVLQVVATYVLWRRPRESAAVALAITACGVTGSTIPWLFGLEVSDLATGWPFVLYGLTAGGLYMLLWPAGAIHLPLAMAGGTRSPSRRTLALAYGIPLGAYACGLIAARLLVSSSSAWVGTWSSVQLLVVLPTVIVGVAIAVRGFRATTPAVRKQVRWALLGGGAAAAVGMSLFMAPELVTGRPLIPWSAAGLVALPLPLGIGFGILRHRLFDLEVVANRTLVYGGATLAIVAIYVVSVTLLGGVLREQGGFPASLLATGLAAIAVLPIRDALQRTVNRVMYGDRDDPYRALARLGERLEATLDPIEAPAVIVRTVAESLRLPWAGLRIGPPGGPTRLIAHGVEPSGEQIAVPLLYGAEAVGDLLVAPRSADEPLTTADRRLLDAFARQTGSTIHALRLTLDLVESRERLVAAREEERRRIRRDLHDGLGPTLAAIGLRAEVAAELAGRDPAAAAGVLGELRTEVQGALLDIRRLVDGLRPPALDELGLVGALRQQADWLGPEPRLDVGTTGELPELPAAVEVAAYRIALEAMTNAARHSGAESCSVVVTEADGLGGHSLVVEVADDGRGLPSRVRPGIGLISMRERAAEVGGTFAMESPPGGGTRIVARLPLNDPPPA